MQLQGLAMLCQKTKTNSRNKKHRTRIIPDEKQNVLNVIHCFQIREEQLITSDNDNNLSEESIENVKKSAVMSPLKQHVLDEDI